MLTTTYEINCALTRYPLSALPDLSHDLSPGQNPSLKVIHGRSTGAQTNWRSRLVRVTYPWKTHNQGDRGHSTPGMYSMANAALLCLCRFLPCPRPRRMSIDWSEGFLTRKPCHGVIASCARRPESLTDLSACCWGSNRQVPTSRAPSLEELNHTCGAHKWGTYAGHPIK